MLSRSSLWFVCLWVFGGLNFVHAVLEFIVQYSGASFWTDDRGVLMADVHVISYGYVWGLGGIYWLFLVKVVISMLFAYLILWVYDRTSR